MIQTSASTYATTIDETALRLSTVNTRYVNLARPDNSGDGTTPATAERSIWAMLNGLSASTTCYVLGSADRNNPTVYPAGDAWLSSVVADLVIVVVSDFTTLAPGWAVSSVEANPTVINGHSSLGTISLHVERMAFRYGNARTFFLQNFASASFVDCDFTLGTQEGLSISSSAAAADHTLTLVRCRAYDNQNGDGFPFTATGAGAVMRVAMIDCEGFGNLGVSSQGSSGHWSPGNTSVHIIRKGGRYYDNGNQAIADVGSAGSGGCSVWMVGVEMSDSSVGNYTGDQGSTWLHGCRLSGNTTDLQTDHAAGRIYVYGTPYKNHTGAGQVVAYAP